VAFIHSCLPNEPGDPAIRWHTVRSSLTPRWAWLRRAQRPMTMRNEVTRWGREAGKIKKGSPKCPNEPVSHQQTENATKATVELVWLRHTPTFNVFNIMYYTSQGSTNSAITHLNRLGTTEVGSPDTSSDPGQIIYLRRRVDCWLISRTCISPRRLTGFYLHGATLANLRVGAPLSSAASLRKR
jgi:hypothetical protein